MAPRGTGGWQTADGRGGEPGERRFARGEDVVEHRELVGAVPGGTAHPESGGGVATAAPGALVTAS